MARITKHQIAVLKEAVSMAADWRGSMVGAAPQSAIDEFDTFIADCQKALSVVRAMRKETTQPRPVRQAPAEWP